MLRLISEWWDWLSAWVDGLKADNPLVYRIFLIVVLLAWVGISHPRRLAGLGDRQRRRPDGTFGGAGRGGRAPRRGVVFARGRPGGRGGPARGGAATRVRGPRAHVGGSGAAAVPPEQDTGGVRPRGETGRDRIASGCGISSAPSTPTPSAAEPSRPTTTGAGASTARDPGMRPRTELGARGGPPRGARHPGRRRWGAGVPDPRPSESPRSTYLTDARRDQRLRRRGLEPRGRGGAVPAAHRGARDPGLRRRRERSSPCWVPRRRSARRRRATCSICRWICCSPGRTSATAIRCLGYQVSPTELDRSRGDAGAGGSRGQAVATGLGRPLSHTPRRSSWTPPGTRGERCACEVPRARAGGHPAPRRCAIAWWRSGCAYPGGRAVTVVADDRLFRNRTLRNTSAGELVLGLVVPRYRRVVVDEFHHGYQAAGSLGARRAGLEHPVALGVGGLAARRRRARGAGRLGRPVRAGARAPSSAGAARRWSTCARSPPRSPPRGGTTWRCAS